MNLEMHDLCTPKWGKPPTLGRNSSIKWVYNTPTPRMPCSLTADVVRE
jgi:hypothetical protein